MIAKKDASSRWKRCLLIILLAIVIIRIGYIFLGDEIDKEYYTIGQSSFDGQESVPCEKLSQHFIADQNSLNRLEFCFRKLAENQTGAVTLSIYSDDELLYQTNISLTAENTGEWNSVFINLPLKEGAEYKTLIDTSPTSNCVPEIIVSQEEQVAQILESAVDGNAIDAGFAVRYGYLRPPALIDKLVMSSLWVFLYIALAVLVNCSDIIRQYCMRFTDNLISQIGETAFICSIELLTCTVVLECSGIEFQPATRIIMYIISAASALRSREKRQYLNQNATTGKKKAILLLLYLYTAFAFVGQRTLIYPIQSAITLNGLLIYGSTLIWAVPVVNSVLYSLDRITVNALQDEGKMSQGKMMVIIFLILLLPAAYNLIANNPAISDVDTYESFEKNAQNLYGMYNWHPAFYSIVLHKIQRIWNSTYAVILVQYFYWTYVVTELLLYLRKKGIRDKVLLLLAAMFGLNAANVLLVNTIWKDVPYAYSMLWLLVITAKLVFDGDEYRRRWYIYLELFVALSFIGLFRKNGVVPLFITSAVFLIAFRKNYKLITVVVASIVFMFYIKGPVYQHYQVIEPGRRGIYIGLGQDILGTYYAGGEVSEETSKMITVMTKYNTAEFDYNPTWAHQSYDLDVEPASFIKCYIDTFLKNPTLMVRTIIDREDCVWDVFEGQDAVVQNKNFTDTEDGDRLWNDYYSKRVFRSIAPLMSSATAYTVENQCLDVITWRCGLLSLLSLITLGFMGIHFGTKRYLIILVPLAGQIFSLLLSTGWTDFRYFWPLNLLNMAMIPLMLAEAGQYRKKLKE